jgi:endonuclease/exonuclease/phosphatase family metal-dependent hydrolase
MFQGMWIVNIYAPSGAEKREERECFFNKDITYLLLTDSDEALIAGDFNCITSPADCTGKHTIRRALYTLIKGMSLRGVWETQPHVPAYTHYTNDKTPRIDRIYITDTKLQRRKQRAERVAAAFCNHFAVIVRMTLEGTSMLQRARMWRMNITS